MSKCPIFSVFGPINCNMARTTKSSVHFLIVLGVYLLSNIPKTTWGLNILNDFLKVCHHKWSFFAIFGPIKCNMARNPILVVEIKI